jgi:hypothetical protein
VRPRAPRICAELGCLDEPLVVRPNALIVLGAEQRKVDYDFASNPRLVCGKLDGETAVSVDVVDRSGAEQSRFELTQRGNHVTVELRRGGTGFELQLPWAAAVSDLVGGNALERSEKPGSVPGDPGGIVIRANAERVSFVWR